MRPVAVWLLAATLLLGGCASPASTVQSEPLIVAAASDLQPAFTLLGEAFEARTGTPVVFNFGSSGQLAQQLIEGAPMDLYASANVAFVERVLAAGVGDPDTQATYAFGRIVLWSQADLWGGWETIEDVIADESVTHLAIANPEHAPYGMAAKQALQRSGVWEAAQPRLVFGENIADAHRLAASRNAEVAITALSLALASAEAGEGRWVPVDSALHDPLQQALLVVSQDPARAARAREFAAYVNSEEGRAVMRRFGFLLPGEAPSPGMER